MNAGQLCDIIIAEVSRALLHCHKKFIYSCGTQAMDTLNDGTYSDGGLFIPYGNHSKGKHDFTRMSLHMAVYNQHVIVAVISISSFRAHFTPPDRSYVRDNYCTVL
jgi:hypothetical protein